MITIKQLVENKQKLDYPAICQALMERFSVPEPVNWNSVLPVPQQQELFGGEVLRLIADYEADHIKVANQKDIRPISLMKGSVSQMLFFFTRLNDASLPKKQIEQITKRFKKGPEANRFIVWFFGNKDSTQLKVVLSAREGKKIVLKTLPFGVNQPYYKTYNFILEEVASKVNRLFVEPTELWKALWSAFDISIVNRRFYDEIKKVFTALIEDLNAKGNPFQSDEDRVQFAIRLIGRIIFCWFLKRKQIIREEALSSAAARHYIDGDYYHDLLEILFFEVMNKPEKERIGGLPKLIAHYPFLNGGLFDAQESDFYKNKPDFRIRIDNKWFFDFFGETLEKYNFTVDENSSSSAEIAIDPEMLGRIFENLLAEQNPDTGESARKATGSFYTPREIVDYMVEQSIAEYLKTSLGIGTDEPELEKNLFGTVPNQQLKIPQPKAVSGLGEAVEDMVHTIHLPDELKPYTQKLLNALNEIKVLDPACGSGAFPMGVLQKLIALKQEILQAQNPKKQFTDAVIYQLKLDTIQNSIYGVDIQPMAVELSRLRCWLSLVVDEEIENIKPLPNLDFKFVCADSLYDLPKQLNLGTAEDAIEELKKIRAEFFQSSGKQKKKLEGDFLRQQSLLFKSIASWAGKDGIVSMLATWKPFENHKADWFDAFWMFGLKNEFDVVIGNPPYKILTKNNTASNLLTHYLNDFISIKKASSKNIYTLFIEMGIRLLSKEGTLSFIVPEGLFTTRSYKDCVEIMNTYGSVVKRATFSSFVFENAVTGNLIFVYSKSKKRPTQRYHFDENYNITEVLETKNSIIDKVHALDTVPLSSVCILFKGMVVSERDSVVGDDSTYGRNKFLLGKSISKWKIVKFFYTDYNSLNIVGGTKLKAKHDVVPRILIRRTGNTLCCVLLNEPALTESTLYSCWSKSPSFLNKYLLALLNSSLFTYYIRQLMITNKQAFPQILMTDLEELPILPLNKDDQKHIISLVDLLLLTIQHGNQLNEYVPNEHIAKQFEELIDACVYELYFPEEVKAKEANVIQLVEQQFKSMDGLPKPEQIELIKKGYQILRDSHSEIRNRLTRQKLVEEIAIINSSLQ